jgi:oligosaccharide repeat unit polymerase
MTASPTTTVYPNDAAIKHEPLRALWWMQPAYIFTIASLGTTYWSVNMSDAGYNMYGCTKYITFDYFWLALSAVVCFLLGTFFANGRQKQSRSDVYANSAFLLQTFWIAIILTFSAYAIWFAVGVKNGFRPGMILDFLRMNESRLETFAFKERIFPTVSGVTTLTQCGMIAVILGVMPALRKERFVLLAVLAVLSAAFVRAFLLSERLALIELVVPMLLMLFRSDVLGQLRHPLSKLAVKLVPIVGPILLLVMFGAFEYFRSYQYYQDRFNNIAEFTVWRVSAYYTTGHNNAALILEKHGHPPLPVSTLSAMWTFPLVRYSPFSYEKLTGINVGERFNNTLRLYSSLEYNNEGGLFAPLLDYGTIGFGIFWLMAGFCCQWAYRRFMAGNTIGLCLYPLLFLALIETPRFMYVSLSRTTPPLVFIFVIWHLLSRRETSPTSTATNNQTPI